MGELLRGENISSAWLSAIEYLLDHERTAVNLCIQIIEPMKEDLGIRRTLDTYLRLHKDQPQPIETVSNTIFPQAFYRPHLGEGARQHFYDLQDEVKEVVRRHKNNKSGTYIARLTNWPGSVAGINQLEETVLKLKRELSRSNPFSSIYEISLGSPRKSKTNGHDVGTIKQEKEFDSSNQDNESEEDAEPLEMNIYSPGKDKRIMAFPCLSHISLTLEKRHLHMTAVYRNQFFVQKAYGNYLGLSRLLQFLSLESGCEPGEILCVATHAYADGGKRELRLLVEECYRSAKGDSRPQVRNNDLTSPRSITSISGRTR